MTVELRHGGDLPKDMGNGYKRCSGCPYYSGSSFTRTCSFECEEKARFLCFERPGAYFFFDPQLYILQRLKA